MTDGTFTLVDARGRKYLTAPERERVLACDSRPDPARDDGVCPRSVDLEASEFRIATLKRRQAHWRAVPVPEDLVHRA